MWQEIEQAISQTTGRVFNGASQQPIGGGCINSCYLLKNNKDAYFVKLNHASLASMFEVEALGLQEMATTQTVAVPKSVCFGIAKDKAYLVLEYLELHSKQASSDRVLGEKLAKMHLVKQDYYGWHHDNTIGSTPQKNQRGHDWLEFYRKQRLEFQLQLAAENGYRGQIHSLGEKLCDNLASFFDMMPQASLLHGDLWGGNYAASSNGEPVIFDPACYYGDREADIAMTELFGGFGADFYAAYNEFFPLDNGYKVRKKLYNLYHILNHLNLFGSGYLSQAESLMQQLLAEI